MSRAQGQGHGIEGSVPGTGIKGSILGPRAGTADKGQCPSAGSRDRAQAPCEVPGPQPAFHTSVLWDTPSAAQAFGILRFSRFALSGGRGKPVQKGPL